MHTKSRIIKTNNKYQLQYDLVDRTGEVVELGVFFWEANLLSTVLMIEKIIKEHGVGKVQDIYIAAQARSKPSHPKYSTFRVGWEFNDLLEKMVVIECTCAEVEYDSSLVDKVDEKCKIHGEKL